MDMPKKVKKSVKKPHRKLYRKAILRRYGIKRWAEEKVLIERAGVAGRFREKRALTPEEAKRLIALCAEFAGSRHVGWVPGDDVSYYGHPIMRRKRPRKGVVGKR